MGFMERQRKIDVATWVLGRLQEMAFCRVIGLSFVGGVMQQEDTQRYLQLVACKFRPRLEEVEWLLSGLFMMPPDIELVILILHWRRKHAKASCGTGSVGQASHKG